MGCYAGVGEVFRALGTTQTVVQAVEEAGQALGGATEVVGEAGSTLGAQQAVRAMQAGSQAPPPWQLPTAILIENRVVCLGCHMAFCACPPQSPLKTEVR